MLEHAGPKTVAPAYRLHTAIPGAGPTDSAVDPTIDSSRPKLVLLRPTDDAAAADVDGDDGSHYERVGVLDRPEPVCLPEAGSELPSLRREQARRRCTTLLRCLGGVAVSTGLIGVFPGMHLAWIVTGLSGLAALGLVGSDGLRQRARGRARSPPPPECCPSGRRRRFIGSASAGYPGAWDEDDFEVPQAAAR